MILTNIIAHTFTITAQKKSVLHWATHPTDPTDTDIKSSRVAVRYVSVQ
jgi:hypothetical protein